MHQLLASSEIDHGSRYYTPQTNPDGWLSTDILSKVHTISRSMLLDYLLEVSLAPFVRAVVG